MERLNAEAAPLHIWLRTQANAPAQRPWFRDTGIGGERAGRVGPGRCRAVETRCPPLALARDRPLSRPHRRDRPRRRRVADRIRRAPAIPADQSRARWQIAGHQHDALRGVDLQFGRCRPGPHPHTQRQPHDPLRERRLYDDRGRALHGGARRSDPDAERHLARPRQRWRRSGRMDRRARLPADGVSRLRLARRGLSGRDGRQCPRPGGHPKGWLFASSLR